MKRSVAPFALVLLAACGGADEVASSKPKWLEAGSAAPIGPSASPLEKYLPLVDGTIFQYETLSFSDAPTAAGGVIVASARRSSTTRGELRLPSGTHAIEYVPDGIVALGGMGDRSYLLQAPLTQGRTWNGPRGAPITLTDVGIDVDVPAGSFHGCVRTAELHSGDNPKKILTTYCPDVGIVILEEASAAGMERASLKHFGPPVNIGPEGVTRTQGNE